MSAEPLKSIYVSRTVAAALGRCSSEEPGGEECAVLQSQPLPTPFKL